MKCWQVAKKHVKGSFHTMSTFCNCRVFSSVATMSRVCAEHLQALRAVTAIATAANTQVVQQRNNTQNVIGLL
jgi:hypothetical protein